MFLLLPNINWHNLIIKKYLKFVIRSIGDNRCKYTTQIFNKMPVYDATSCGPSAPELARIRIIKSPSTTKGTEIPGYFYISNVNYSHAESNSRRPNYQGLGAPRSGLRGPSAPHITAMSRGSCPGSCPG